METSAIVRNVITASYGVVYAVADPNKIYDAAAIAKAANTCLSMKGIHAAFVIGKTSARETKLSARSDGLINVSLLCEKLGGGGHFTSAAATFLKSDLKDVENMLVNVINLHLADARADAKKRISQEE